MVLHLLVRKLLLHQFGVVGLVGHQQAAAAYCVRLHYVDLCHPSVFLVILCLQLWQAAGYNLQRQVVPREAYFPELSAPAAVHKQLPPEGLETGQQKRAKLWNGQYRSRAAAPAGLYAAETPQPVGVAHKQQHSRHITPGLAAAGAAAAAGQQRQQHNSVLASPSSSSSHDSAGYGPRRPSCGSAAEPVPLRALTVPWPLPVSIKGRRNSRQRRSNWAQWTAILHAGAAGGAAAAASTAGGSAPAAAACPAGDAMDLEQHTAADGVQQLPELEHQQSGVLQDGQQQQHSQPAHQQPVMQPRPLRPLQAIVQQQQHGEHDAKQQQKEAAALLQQMAPATPSHIKLSHTAFAALSGAAPGLAGKQHAAEIAAAAGGDGSLHETSTSSEQTHDGMNESPRDPIREPLSSWPSSSTDSVCQLQQQQQFLLLQQQQGKVGSGVQRKAALAAVDGGWGSPGSPLPATAL